MTDQKKSRIQEARRIAFRIIELGQAIDAGTATFDDFVEHTDATIMLFCIRSSGKDFGTANAFAPVTPEHVETIAGILGEDAPKFDDIITAEEKIRTFIVKAAWDVMVKSEHMPDGKAYQPFHTALVEIGLDPQEDAVLEFLSVTRDVFKRIDQTHALVEIKNALDEFINPLERAFLYQMAKDRSVRSEGEISLNEAFTTSMAGQDAMLTHDLNLIIDQSGLTEQQVKEYLQLWDDPSPDFSRPARPGRGFN